MKYQELQRVIKNPWFSRQEIRLQKLNLYSYQLTLWRRKGYLEKIRKGLYLFTERKHLVPPQEISFLLYQPSYISLEFALSHYGIIPEIAYSITAITTKTTRSTYNSFGNFIYRNIKPELFFGYVTINTTFGKYLLAEGQKALLDFFYMNSASFNDIKDLQELRLNYDELKKTIKTKKIKQYLDIFNSKKLSYTIKLLYSLC